MGIWQRRIQAPHFTWKPTYDLQLLARMRGLPLGLAEACNAVVGASRTAPPGWAAQQSWHDPMVPSDARAQYATKDISLISAFLDRMCAGMPGQAWAGIPGFTYTSPPQAVVADIAQCNTDDTAIKAVMSRYMREQGEVARRAAAEAVKVVRGG